MAERYTEEQKANVVKFLEEGKTHQEIADLTNVKKATISKMSAALKPTTSTKGTSKKSKAESSNFKEDLQVELANIKARKEEVQELLNVILKKELEELDLREIALSELIKLYP